jgi:hypothetical protein
MNHDEKPKAELVLSLADLRPEELEPRLELQVLVDPVGLALGTLSDNNNNNNILE